MDLLPIEIVQQIAAHLSLNDIINMSKANKEFKYMIYNSVEFWKYKIRIDFKNNIENIHKNNVENIRKLYKRKMQERTSPLCGSCFVLTIYDVN